MILNSEDDEEVASTMLRMAPPERPRPPSARSGGTPRMDGGEGNIALDCDTLVSR